MESITQWMTSLLTAQSGASTITQLTLGLLVAYLGGLLSSFTPCVYPMIPITVGVIGGGSDRTWKKLVARSLVYLSGMALVYALLGVVAGLTGQIFGTLTNTYGFYLALGIFISFAALVMLEVIPFDPAVWIENIMRRFQKQKPHSKKERGRVTLLGTFGLGATSGFIAAPCTTPILATILAFIAKTQSVFMGFVLMLGFSLGLGTLLLAIAFFTGALQILPRSGKWLKLVKLVSGIILLGLGEYLIYQAGALGGTF